MLALSEPPSFTLTLKPQPCSLAGDTLGAVGGGRKGWQQGLNACRVWLGYSVGSMAFTARPNRLQPFLCLRSQAMTLITAAAPLPPPPANPPRTQPTPAPHLPHPPQRLDDAALALAALVWVVHKAGLLALVRHLQHRSALQRAQTKRLGCKVGWAGSGAGRQQGMLPGRQGFAGRAKMGTVPAAPAAL